MNAKEPHERQGGKEATVRVKINYSLKLGVSKAWTLSNLLENDPWMDHVVAIRLRMLCKLGHGVTSMYATAFPKNGDLLIGCSSEILWCTGAEEPLYYHLLRWRRTDLF